ncbi:MAG: type II/IV secretion system protein, partial [Gammaproteobacteria bacterium]
MSALPDFSTAEEGAEQAVALASALHIEYWGAAELFQGEPAFDRLGTADAMRRNCVVVRREGQLFAALADPLDATLRPWLESRIPECFTVVVASRGDIRAYIARHEQSMRAMDAALEVAQGSADGQGEVEALSLASISQDASPVVKLVHSTLFDALRAGASDIHLETSPTGLV